MFPRLLSLFSQSPPTEQGRGFVEEVRLVDALPKPNRRIERVLLVCWVAIAAKCWLVVWLIEKYHMNFSPLWVTAPTILFALICTGAYFFRE